MSYHVAIQRTVEDGEPVYIFSREGRMLPELECLRGARILYMREVHDDDAWTELIRDHRLDFLHPHGMN
jgi:hypothetical protein